MSDSNRHVFLEGPRVFLRAPEAADLEGPWFQWLNDAEVCRHNGHAIFPNTAKKMRDFFESTQNTHDSIHLAVCLKEDGRHVGNISLLRLSWIDRSAEFAILMGDRQVWGTGIATEASELLVEYAFTRLNLHRVHCGTSSENIGMQKLALRLGMQLEGTRRQAMFKNGAYHDIHVYGVLRDEYLARTEGRRA